MTTNYLNRTICLSFNKYIAKAHHSKEWCSASDQNKNWCQNDFMKILNLFRWLSVTWFLSAVRCLEQLPWCHLIRNPKSKIFSQVRPQEQPPWWHLIQHPESKTLQQVQLVEQPHWRHQVQTQPSSQVHHLNSHLKSWVWNIFNHGCEKGLK